MDDGASARAVWTLTGNVAQLALGQFAGKVDVARPDLGLHSSALDHGSARCALFCTRRADESSSTKNSSRERSSKCWPLTLADAYVRGNDLVTSYNASDEWPYAPQLYWQADSLQMVEGTLASLSHLVSVQTHLLDTHPSIQVTSHISSSETLFISMGEDGVANVDPVNSEASVAPCGSTICVLWRPLAAPVSYIEVATASDLRTIEFVPDADGRWMARWHLFAEFLEKGVIRRARVHGILLPRANDTELALECCRAAAQCPLPLTT